MSNRKTEYAKKLKRPEWQKKRLEVFERDGWTCQCCGSKDKTLHVHHLYYFGEPWEVDDRALETLCEDCHFNRSEKERNFIEGLRFASTKRAMDFYDALESFWNKNPSGKVLEIITEALNNAE